MSESALLTLEAQRVIALRMAALAAGGARAQAEAQRMFTEKVITVVRVGGMLTLGSSPASAIRHYRSRVRANERRLSQRRRR
jgi:hypothetical protein